jgi:hypothetical protein
LYMRTGIATRPKLTVPRHVAVGIYASFAPHGPFRPPAQIPAPRRQIRAGQYSADAAFPVHYGRI